MLVAGPRHGLHLLGLEGRDGALAAGRRLGLGASPPSSRAASHVDEPLDRLRAIEARLLTD